MTRIWDDPADFAAASLRGYCAAWPDHVRAVPGGVVRATATKPGKVALVAGGGSGHFPAYAGFVGRGCADASVAGDVFASPSARLVHDVCLAADRGAGILLCFGNYAGDVLNFGLGAERLRAGGIDVRAVAITDDVASAGPQEREKRRGVAGNLAVVKVAGAAAEADWPLDEVERIAREANARTRSFGVAFSGCTLPGAAAPLFEVAEGRAALGLGIHGEPGIEEVAMPEAGGLARLMVSRVLSDAPEKAGARVGVVLNSLGATRQEELFVLWDALLPVLAAEGLTVVAPLVGDFTSSLDMAGCSLSLFWLDEELEALWTAPCDTPGVRVGWMGPGVAATEAVVAVPERPARHMGDAASHAAGQAIAGRLGMLARAMAAAEAELGRIDAAAGDGDHGQAMTRGSAAAVAAAREASEAGAGAAGVLGEAADAWADRAGGTSGAIWGVGLRAASSVLRDEGAVEAATVARAVHEALARVVALGGARLGDKTLVDVLAPFAETLSNAVSRDEPLAGAWGDAVRAAETAAEATAALTPRIGRARPLAERSRGHRDAGAVSLSLAARAVLDGRG